MKKMSFLASAAIFVSLMTIHVSAHKAEAVMEMSVTPQDGGTSMRFSRGDLNLGVTKNIRIRITSNDNVQYQVFQQLVNTFTNERGITIDRPVLKANIVPGSSGSGTTYLASYEPLNRGEQLLYTSSGNGASESFTLVYSVDSQYLSDSGNFNGLIQFILKPVSGGQRQTVQTNVFIESNAELTVSAEGSTAPDIVKLDTSPNALPAFVKMSFSGNTGTPLKVYAEVLTKPINELNSELESGIIKIAEDGGQNGDLSFTSPVDLPRNRALVYKSNQQSDSFSIVFTIPPDSVSKLTAGSYHGLVRFSFETDHIIKTFDIDLDIIISPVFEISMDFPQGAVKFSRVLPGGDPQIKEVNVTVNSNLARPYVVNQNVADYLINDKGQAVPKNFFEQRQVIFEGYKGIPDSDKFNTVEQGDKVIFKSDKQGSSTKFKVYYRLSPFNGMQAGDYKTSIVYSLNQL